VERFKYNATTFDWVTFQSTSMKVVYIVFFTLCSNVRATKRNAECTSTNYLIFFNCNAAMLSTFSFITSASLHQAFSGFVLVFLWLKVIMVFYEDWLKLRQSMQSGSKMWNMTPWNNWCVHKSCSKFLTILMWVYQEHKEGLVTMLHTVG